MTTNATNDDGLTFKQWYAQVDRVVISIAGLGIDDIADGNSWDAWNDGAPAREYAIEALADDGFPFDLIGEI